MKKKLSFLVFPILFFTISCNGVGKGGQYKDIPGKATIKEIKSVTGSCPDSVDVVFDFKPDEPDAIKKYYYPNFSDTGERMFTNLAPSRAWVEKKGIKVGNVYPAKRSEMIPGTGTSSPVGLYITDNSVNNVSEPDFCK
jgi:hypothetical protein